MCLNRDRWPGWQETVDDVNAMTHTLHHRKWRHMHHQRLGHGVILLKQIKLGFSRCRHIRSRLRWSDWKLCPINYETWSNEMSEQAIGTCKVGEMDHPNQVTCLGSLRWHRPTSSLGKKGIGGIGISRCLRHLAVAWPGIGNTWHSHNLGYSLFSLASRWLLASLFISLWPSLIQEDLQAGTRGTLPYRHQEPDTDTIFDPEWNQTNISEQPPDDGQWLDHDQTWSFRNLNISRCFNWFKCWMGKPLLFNLCASGHHDLDCVLSDDRGGWSGSHGIGCHSLSGSSGMNANPNLRAIFAFENLVTRRKLMNCGRDINIIYYGWQTAIWNGFMLFLQRHSESNPSNAATSGGVAMTSFWRAIFFQFILCRRCASPRYLVSAMSFLIRFDWIWFDLIESRREHRHWWRQSPLSWRRSLGTNSVVANLDARSLSDSQFRCQICADSALWLREADWSLGSCIKNDQAIAVGSR